MKPYGRGSCLFGVAFRRAFLILPSMPSTFDFCIPTRSAIVPHGPDGLHEIKYDSYRLRLERDGNRVRLISRNGYDWTKRYPWIGRIRAQKPAAAFRH